MHTAPVCHCPLAENKTNLPRSRQNARCRVYNGIRNTSMYTGQLLMDMTLQIERKSRQLFCSYEMQKKLTVTLVIRTTDITVGTVKYRMYTSGMLALCSSKSVDLTLVSFK